MIELKKKTIEVRYGDKSFELAMCPTMKAKELFKKMKSIDQEKDIDELIDLQLQVLVDCGLPAELQDKLDFEQFGELANAVMGVKKS